MTSSFKKLCSLHRVDNEIVVGNLHLETHFKKSAFLGPERSCHLNEQPKCIKKNIFGF